jgi:bacterioferritin
MQSTTTQNNYQSDTQLRGSTSSARLTDKETIRQRARQNIESGAVTPSYNADREEVIRLLNEALATELVCYLRYKRHYFVADGIQAEPVAAEFLEHATQEQQHADQIAVRIVQLGGSPDFSPEGLAARSHAQYVEGGSLKDMVRENLIAERIAIESYREIAQYIGEKDPTTRRIMEEILATEEEHADDLVSLMRGLKD